MVFSNLNNIERHDHIKDLWKIAFLKAKGAYFIKRFFRSLHEKMIINGTTQNISLEKRTKVMVFIGEKPMLILLQDNKFKNYWNILMMFLLLYVAIWVPFSICMLPVTEGVTFAKVLDNIVDFLFLIDMIV